MGRSTVYQSLNRSGNCFCTSSSSSLSKISSSVWLANKSDSSVLSFVSRNTALISCSMGVIPVPPFTSKIKINEGWSYSFEISEIFLMEIQMFLQYITCNHGHSFHTNSFRICIFVFSYWKFSISVINKISTWATNINCVPYFHIFQVLRHLSAIRKFRMDILEVNLAREDIDGLVN